MPAWLRTDCRRTLQSAGLVVLFVCNNMARAEDALPTAIQENWYAITLNHQPLPGTALLLQHADGTLLIHSRDLQDWGLRLPEAEPQWRHGEAYYPLNELPGLTYQLDEHAQSITIESLPASFLPTHRRLSAAPFPAPTPSGPGAFVNYDVLAEHLADDTLLNGLLELGVFNGAGAGTASVLRRDFAGEAQWLRLETTWTHDRPAALASLRLGDAISRPGAWGRPVRFGGVQWTTNFAVQPGFVAFPLPSVAGEAALPATVDLYVNDSLRARQAVPPGPFQLTELPVITGDGELRVVVRDLLGREQVLSEHYYASPRLLRPGVTDFSYETGFVRENFALASNDYGRFFAAATYRASRDEHFTGELRAEWLRTQQTLGASGMFLWEPVGVFTASAAASRNEETAGRDGALGILGFERQGRRFSLSLRTQAASADFVQLGLPAGEPAPARQNEARLGFSLSGAGTLGLGYVEQAHRHRPDTEITSLSYQLGLAGGSLILSALRLTTEDDTQQTEHMLAATFTLPLGARTSASLGATRQDGDDRSTFLVQRNLPAGEGVGYRLLASEGVTDSTEAGVSIQGPVGTYTAAIAHASGDTAWRLGAAGGLAWLDADLIFARRLTDSFAVVRAGDYPDVAVYADNQPVARTDASGRALVPRLRAYQPNRLRIEQADLPLDAEIEAIERTVVPYYRSGLVVPFAVRPARGALLRIVFEDGTPLPSGAQVYIDESDQAFPVALDGEVYLTGLSTTRRLRARWNGHQCEFDVPPAPPGDPLPDLGTFVCTRSVP